MRQLNLEDLLMKLWSSLLTCLVLTFSVSAQAAQDPKPVPPPAAKPAPAPAPAPVAAPTTDATPAETPAVVEPQPPMEGTVTTPPPAENVPIAAPQPVETTPVAPAITPVTPQLDLPATPADSVLQLGAGWKLKINGYVHLNTYYVSDEVFSIDSPAYVMLRSPGAFNENNSGLAFGARDTRLRLQFSGPKAWNFDPSALIEVDFFGNLPNSGTSIRQGQLRMRLAYAEMKQGNLVLRFGNDWMVAAPQFMTTFDPFNGWAQGNLWMRTPQAKMLYNKPFGDDFRLETGFMVGQSLGGDNPKSTQLRNTGIGEASLIPLLQARLGAGFRIGEDSDFSTLGLSGSYQKLDFRGSPTIKQAEYDALVALGHDKMDSWFVAIDGQLNYKLHGIKFQLTGEYSYGQATGMFWGGILQSYQFTMAGDPSAIADVTPVKSIGYFGDLKVTFPCGFWTFLGMGRSVVDEDDIVVANSPVKNTYYYGGVALTKGPMTFGLSAGWLSTEYIQVEDAQNALLLQGFTSITF
ncbi:MAG: hypothetical protein CVU59_09755 [Deltaproteobacteria bacterium HGW-Deltaproteobacteria-17]|nr:MAG: hypothetical protein CVU59_09755 [Deltaproteobacteria bacterium HGW-Deltaproteobacteria-17]